MLELTSMTSPPISWGLYSFQTRLLRKYLSSCIMPRFRTQTRRLSWNHRRWSLSERHISACKAGWRSFQEMACHPRRRWYRSGSSSSLRQSRLAPVRLI